MNRTINFLGIGGHACGSTKLYQLLNSHPSVGFVNPTTEHGVDIRGKECHYWDRYAHLPVSWYLSLFQWQYPVVGEITPAYARLDEHTVAQIHQLFPDTHIFFIIRDTYERTWSDVRKNITIQRIESPNLDWMISYATSEKVRLRNDYVRTAQLWHKYYGAQLHVINFANLVTQPRTVIHHLSDVLNIDAMHYDSMPATEIDQQINPTAVQLDSEAFAHWFHQHSEFQWQEQLHQIRQFTHIL
jgi:hypothetical protein